MDKWILLKSKTNYECPSSQHLSAGGRAEGRHGGVGAVPGSGDDVGGEGPTVVSALGTGIQIPGCVGCVRYGAPMSPGLVGLIEGCQRV